MMKTSEEQFPPADIIFYAHDGRGLGHISRSVAIGLAVRRLYPKLRLLLLTGGAQTQELIGPGSLDWLKLPAYQTVVVGGRSRGIHGKSAYSDHELGLIRGHQIRRILNLYRPRIVLADHSPQGKHKELLPSLQDPEIRQHTTWFLGIRGVVGKVKQTASDLAIDLFRQYYSGLLWYGDSAILGSAHCQSLNRMFSTVAEECGYVSRMTEVEKTGGNQRQRSSRFRCTISVPWAGEQSERFLELLARYLQTAGHRQGRFNLFFGSDISLQLIERFAALDCCTVYPFGSNYLQILNHSRTALIYGGYNSLVDVMASGMPALVVMRSMQDQEQQQHLFALSNVWPNSLFAVDETDCLNNPALLGQKLSVLLAADRSGVNGPAANFSGAEHAARFLASRL